MHGKYFPTAAPRPHDVAESERPQIIEKVTRERSFFIDGFQSPHSKLLP
jgi:hypothetical protein